jgi:hypothetical protein
MVTRESARRLLGVLLGSAFVLCTVALYVAARDGQARRSGGSAAVAEQASLPDQDYGHYVPSWYYAQSPAQVQALLGTDNRLVSIDVERASPLLLNVAMIRNSGVARKTWWWVPGTGPDMPGAELGGYCAFREGRIVNLDPYVMNGTTYFAAVLVSSAGSDDKGWWWYFDQSSSIIGKLTTEHNARLVDLRSYVKDRARLYAFVMIPNVGSDESAWWWYPGVSAAAVEASLKENKASLTSLRPADKAGRTFDAVMTASATSTLPVFEGVSWIWGTSDTD